MKIADLEFFPLPCVLDIEFCIDLRVFGLQKYSRSLTRRVFNVRERSQGFPGTISAFKSILKTFPKHFCSLGAFPRVSLRVFALREYSHGFAGIFSGFGNAPEVSLGVFSIFGSILSHRDALPTEFCLVRAARIFVRFAIKNRQNSWSLFRRLAASSAAAVTAVAEQSTRCLSRSRKRPCRISLPPFPKQLTLFALCFTIIFV